LLTQYFWPENFRINELVKLLRINGCEIIVLTGCPNYPKGIPFDGYKWHGNFSEVYVDDIKVYRIPIILRGKASGVRLFLNYFSFIVSGILFGSRLLKNEKFDLVFVYAPSPIFQAIVGVYFRWTRKVPLITWVQDLWPETLAFTGHIKNKLIISGIAKVVSWIYRKNDLLLTQSKSFVGSVKRRSGPVDVIYFPNPGELSEAGSVQILNDSELFLESGFNIVFAGNLGVVQSLPVIVEAAELLRKHSAIRFIFFGAGSKAEWLADEVGRRSLANIILAGQRPSNEMPGIFKRASVLLVSLIGDPILNQTVPAKLQSYLGAGKPIIASLDGDGARIVLEAGAGLVCPTENSIALAEAVLKLSRISGDELSSMGQAGKRYFDEHFDPQILNKKLISIFQETIKKHTEQDSEKSA
jgi:glycosyltransferase involved in cell wall biosynthesis